MQLKARMPNVPHKLRQKILSCWETPKCSIRRQILAINTTLWVQLSNQWSIHTSSRSEGKTYRKQSGQACANSSCLSTLCFWDWEPQWRARWCFWSKHLCCTSPRSTEPPSCSVSICHICSLVLDTWHMYCPHICADSQFPSHSPQPDR